MAYQRKRPDPEVLKKSIQRLRGRGMAFQEIAKILEISERTARRIHKAAAQSVRGRPSRLTQSMRQDLKAKLLKGARAAGYDSDTWSVLMVRDLIERNFLVTYRPKYIFQLLRNMGILLKK